MLLHVYKGFDFIGIVDADCDPCFSYEAMDSDEIRWYVSQDDFPNVEREWKRRQQINSGNFTGLNKE